MLHSINAERRLFVLSEGDGYSCFGFDNAYRHALQIAELTRTPKPDPSLIGTAEGYEQYRAALRVWADHVRGRRVPYFDPGTPPQVRGVLARLIDSGDTVRIYLGDVDSGRDWLEDCDVYGRLALSMGPMQVPLLIEPRKHGGAALLTACILRIQHASSRRDLYRHPNYLEPCFQLRGSDDEQRPVAVYAYNQLVANFENRNKARKYSEFMRGDQMSRH